MSGQKSPPEIRAKLTDEEIRALSAWRMLTGKRWKSKLLDAWQIAGEGVRGYSPILQQLRNRLGPTWLVRLGSIPAVTQCEPPMLSGSALRSPAAAVTVTLTEEQARALHWLSRHLGFDDALRCTPPHLGKDVCTERAYGIVHAAAALEEQLMSAQMHGDPWMYAS